jgi:hypothetical protein
MSTDNALMKAMSSSSALVSSVTNGFPSFAKLRKQSSGVWKEDIVRDFQEETTHWTSR